MTPLYVEETDMTVVKDASGEVVCAREGFLDFDSIKKVMAHEGLDKVVVEIWKVRRDKEQCITIVKDEERKDYRSEI